MNIKSAPTASDTAAATYCKAPSNKTQKMRQKATELLQYLSVLFNYLPPSYEPRAVKTAGPDAESRSEAKEKNSSALLHSWVPERINYPQVSVPRWSSQRKGATQA